MNIINLEEVNLANMVKVDNMAKRVVDIYMTVDKDNVFKPVESFDELNQQNTIISTMLVDRLRRKYKIY